MKLSSYAQFVQGIRAEFVVAAKQALPIYFAPLRGAVKQVGDSFKLIQGR